MSDRTGRLKGKRAGEKGRKRCRMCSGYGAGGRCHGVGQEGRKRDEGTREENKCKATGKSRKITSDEVQSEEG